MLKRTRFLRTFFQFFDRYLRQRFRLTNIPATTAPPNPTPSTKPPPELRITEPHPTKQSQSILSSLSAKGNQPAVLCFHIHTPPQPRSDPYQPDPYQRQRQCQRYDV